MWKEPVMEIVSALSCIGNRWLGLSHSLLDFFMSLNCLHQHFLCFLLALIFKRVFYQLFILHADFGIQDFQRTNLSQFWVFQNVERICLNNIDYFISGFLFADSAFLLIHFNNCLAGRYIDSNVFRNWLQLFAFLDDSINNLQSFVFIYDFVAISSVF